MVFYLKNELKRFDGYFINSANTYLIWKTHLSKNLLKEFKSPAKILCASEKELLNIEKLGPKKYKLMKEILDLEGEH